MDLSAQKEQFSIAYVGAVVATAGYSSSSPNVDDDSVDLCVAARGGRGSIRSPRLDLQLKCTSRHTPANGELRFPLKTKNYDDLRHDDLHVPRLLVVVVVPDDITKWIHQTEEEMALRRCGFWKSLCGEPERPNKSAVTVTIPTSQVFSPEALAATMEQIARGERP